MAHRDNESLVASSIAALCSVDGAWDFLRNYEPEEGKGFMFSSLPEKGQQIQDALIRVNPGHSGASLALLIRHLQLIARTRHDVKVAKSDVAQDPTDGVAEKRTEFVALGNSMTLAEQWDQLVKHKDTPMTYMEMRERFG